MESTEIMTNVILSSVLEAIPNKIGCTSKLYDWQAKSKFEYFLIAGVNIGKCFYNLSERIINNNYKQPLIYDIAYIAQQESLKNRNGGKINFGIIELFVPIITTQVLFNDNSINVLDRVEDVLKHTTKEDVKYHLLFRQLAHSVSKSLPNITDFNVENMYQYYELDKGYENLIHKEYITRFPTIKTVYKYLSQHKQRLMDATIEIYDIILDKCNGYCGLAADYICIGLYFILNNNPNIKIM